MEAGMRVQKSFSKNANSRQSFLDREQETTWELWQKGEELEEHCYIIGM